MNYPARVFRDLSSTWQQDAASSRADVLAAELTSCVAVEGTLCLGLIRAEAAPKFFGLVYFLDSYGVLLRKRHQKGHGEDGKGGVLVFAEVKPEAASEFAGAVVSARAVTPPKVSLVTPVEFAQAA